MLTPQQKTLLATALRAETDQGVVDALAIGNAVFLQEWCNGLSNVDAWMYAANGQVLFEAMNIAKFDTLTAGKRDAWKVMMDQVVDFERQKMRNAVVDIWGATDAVAVLQGVIEKARRVEVYIGGQSRTTQTVTALSRNFHGTVTHTEISQALNENPA